jgi:hypothetical protein
VKISTGANRGIKRCLDFITGGAGDPGSVRDQLCRLEARKREIIADLKTQQGDMEFRDPSQPSGPLSQESRQAAAGIGR